MKTSAHFRFSFCVLLSGLFFSLGLSAQRQTPEWVYSGNVVDLLSDDNTLWIVIDNQQLVKMDKESRQVVVYNSKNGGIPEDIRALAKDRAGNIWMTSFNAGLCKFDGFSCQFFKPESKDIPDRWYSGLHIDPEDNKWLGRNIWLLKYNNEEWETWRYGSTSSSLIQYINSIASDKNNTIWYGAHTLGNAFGRLHNSKIEAFPNLEEEPYPGIEIYCVTTDADNNIWIGTSHSGLVKYNGKNYTFYDQTNALFRNDVKDIVCDAAGNLWFANGTYLVKYDGKTFKSCTDPLFGAGISKIRVDENGDIWIGIQNKGLIHYREENCQWIDFQGIPQTQQKETFWLYPNPASNDIHIDTAEEIGRIKSIWVMDMVGRAIGSLSTGVDADSMYTTSLSTLNIRQNGIYWLQITTTKGTFSQKLMVTGK